METIVNWKTLYIKEQNRQLAEIEKSEKIRLLKEFKAVICYISPATFGMSLFHYAKIMMAETDEELWNLIEDVARQRNR